MIFEQIRSEGLAHYSYIVGDKNKAAVIDPRRDIEVYLDIASENDLDITHVFETHRNEDYVIGSVELKDAVDAEIYHSKGLDFRYGNPVEEGDRFSVGTLVFEVLETPGHTDESISLILRIPESPQDPYMVFTGDALFAGDVGRTDLYGFKERERLAKNLYESLHDKLLKLEDGTIVCPAHGEGSVCGESINDQPVTTIGYEKRNNPLLDLSLEEFIAVKKDEKIHRPPYFRKMEDYNKNGAPLLGRKNQLDPISCESLKKLTEEEAQVVDIRSPSSFAGGHIPDSINIWRGGLPFFIGWVLDYDDPIILIDDFNLGINEAAKHFTRLGYDNLKGYLAGGFSSWFKEGNDVRTLNIWTVHDLKGRIEDEDLFLLDVRTDKVWQEEAHIPRAKHIYIGDLANNLEDVPTDKHIVIYCDTGFKTNVAASILLKNDYENITALIGGFMAWETLGYPVEE